MIADSATWDIVGVVGDIEEKEVRLRRSGGCTPPYFSNTTCRVSSTWRCRTAVH